MDVIGRYSSPLGGMTLASDGTALVGLWFDGQKYFGSTLGDRWAEGGDAVLETTARWLERYFSGREPDFTPPLALRGSAFRQSVWRALMEIPYGTAITYGQLAARLGLGPRAARAVGGAVAHNPISLIVPCHRVLGADGSLTGYAGGADKKARLLALERGGVSGDTVFLSGHVLKTGI